ncbi:MAG: lipopolysaccharide heptosyltransferase II [Rhodoferax sp.]
MTRTLIIAPQWIGDAVMTEPLLRRLQARGERLTVGALPWVAPVYRAMAQVERVIEFPFVHGGLQWSARRAMARELRGQFDRAVVCPNSLKSALIPWWAGVEDRVGYHGESRWGLLSTRLPNPSKKDRPPMVEFYGALSGEGGFADAQPRLNIASSGVDAVLAALNLARDAYSVLVPGAEYGPAKRWPGAHFAELACQLAQTRGQTIVLLGSAKDAPVGAEIAQAVQAAGSGPCLDLSGRTGLADALALVSAARAVVSNDSGMMHVAAAFGVPQVAIFGSSNPRHTPPLSAHARVVWLKDDPRYQPALDCAPCYERVCPLGHTRCLQDVTAQRVRALLP